VEMCEPTVRPAVRGQVAIANERIAVVLRD
jgi:hypothetical protein